MKPLINNINTQVNGDGDYPIMELTYGKPTSETAIDIRTGETIPSGDEVFYHKGTPLRISFLNDQFGKNNYKVLTSSDGRKFVVHKGHQGLTDSDIQLLDWSNSDNSFDRTLAQAYKSTGLKPNTDNEEEEPGFWQDLSTGFNNAMKREFGWLGYGGKDSSRFKSNNAAYRRDPQFMNNWGINLSREEAELIPFVGDGVSAAGVANDFAKGDYTKAGMNALWFFVPNIVEKPVRGLWKWGKNTGVGKWLTDQVSEGTSDLWSKTKNWWNKEHDVSSYLMDKAGYTKVYHGSPYKFDLRDYKSSANNIGLHVTTDKNVARNIALSRGASAFNNGLVDKIPDANVMSGYIRKKDYRTFIDNGQNDLAMLNPNLKVWNDYISYPVNDPMAWLHHKAIPGSTLQQNPSAFTIYPNKSGQKYYTVDMQKANWPDMPQAAKEEYNSLVSRLKSGEISEQEANTLAESIFTKHGLPVVKYKNMWEGIGRKNPYDYIIFDRNAIKFQNMPDLKLSNGQMILGGAAGGAAGYGLYNLLNTEEEK